MPADQWTWSSEQRISSESMAAGKVISQLLKQLIAARWQDQDTFGVHLALEEALANAIKHGNREDPTKRIDVELRLSPERVRIEIGDEGVGFDPSSVPDPTDDRNLELPTGRGLMLMRSYMTSVQFNDRGNRVVMEKRRTQLSATESSA